MRVSPAQSRRRSSRLAAFTLIELLTVIAIIGVLAAITFGVARGVQERAAISQARSELNAIATALESYKRQYGDYPQTGVYTAATPPTAASATDVAGYLLNALAGKLGPKRAAIDGKAFLDLSQLNLFNTTLPAATGNASVANGIVDPWGRPYIYSYRDNGATAGDWVNPTYVLLSAGPDGRLAIPTTGIVDKTAADNADNIYSN